MECGFPLLFVVWNKGFRSALLHCLCPGRVRRGRGAPAEARQDALLNRTHRSGILATTPLTRQIGLQKLAIIMHRMWIDGTDFGSSDGYIKSEDSTVNGHNVKPNADGTFTAYFGSKASCGDLPNRLDITEGWNFLMRIYRPGPSVLDGAYQLPKAEAIK